MCVPVDDMVPVVADKGERGVVKGEDMQLWTAVQLDQVLLVADEVSIEVEHSQRQQGLPE